MENILYEIAPSQREKNSHRLLGYVSAFLGILLMILVLWAVIKGKIGTWSFIILLFPVPVFIAVSRFVLKRGVDYIMGLRINNSGIAAFFPLQKEPASQETDLILFEQIERIEFEENLEVHRTGRKYRRFNVYRVYVLQQGQSKPEILAEMVELRPEEILKFRDLPAYLIQRGLIPESRIDVSRMPVI